MEPVSTLRGVRGRAGSRTRDRWLETGPWEFCWESGKLWAQQTGQRLGDLLRPPEVTEVSGRLEVPAEHGSQLSEGFPGRQREAGGVWGGEEGHALLGVSPSGRGAALLRSFRSETPRTM